jgi:peptidoglycan/LPS O-acetylase OafA/YrhL
LAGNKIPVLDGIRGIAVLLVICVHFSQAFPDQPPSLISKLALWGQTGVDLFFVLSGFLITGTLLRAKGSRHFIRNFWAKRVLRIFPLYYLTLMGVYWVWPALHITHWVPWQKSIWYWLEVQDVALGFAPALQKGPEYFWSLAVEEHFYIFWPFAVLLLDAGKLYRIAGAAVVVSLICRFAMGQDYFPYYFTLSRLDGLAVGSALAIYLNRNTTERMARLSPWALRFFCLIGLALIVQLVLPKFPLPVVHVFRDTLVALVYASAMLLAMNNQQAWVSKLLSTPLMRSTGTYSYSIYVFHPFLITWLKFRGMSYSLPWLGVTMVVSYAAGWLSWHVLEGPVLKLKRRFQAVDVVLPERKVATASA